jgi:hypothetical protein
MDATRRTRAAYHYATRGRKNPSYERERERMATALLYEGGRNVWSEIGKRMGASKSVDGLTEVEEVAQPFATKYRQLYTSVPYDHEEMQALIN